MIDKNELLHVEIIEKEKEYWLKKLGQSDFSEEVFPLDKTSEKYSKGEVIINMNEEINHAINSLFKDNALMEYIVFTSSVFIMFHELFNKKDCFVISPVINKKEIFENKYIVINECLNKNLTIKETLNKVKDAAAGAYKNQHVNLHKLFKEEDLGENILQCAVNYNKVHKNQDLIEGKLITFNFLKEDRKVKLKIEYNEENLYKDTVLAVSRTLEKIIKDILKDRNKALKDISLITDFDKKILEDINNNDSEYPENFTILDAFNKSVSVYGDNIAVEYNDKSLTYKEVDVLSNKLANYINEQKYLDDTDYIGILMDKSHNTVIAALAILKAGKAYVPLNPESPEDRIREIIEDASINFIVASEGFIQTLENIKRRKDIKYISMDSEEVLKDYNEELDFDSCINRDSKAYVIYTSGTTGKSKGVIIKHSNVINLILNNNIPYKFTSEDTWTMFHSYCFDFSVWEMYGALLNGGKLIVIPKKTARDTERFYDLLIQKKVTVLNQTPGAFYNLIEVDNLHREKALNLRYIIFGGEALNPVKLSSFIKSYKDTALFNMYGITETTVHVTFKKLTQEDTKLYIFNIGKPLPNYKVFIVNKNKKKLPIGIKGELLIAGEGVSAGYLNRNELTKSKFITNEELGGRVYCSGDLAAIMNIGDLRYLGRIDSQVKIRGHRIEIGEVEHAILEDKNIKNAIVIPKKLGNSSTELCCYYCSESGITVSEFKERLKKNLPSYSIPAYYVHINNIPLNRNGKIDKKKLPNPLENIYKKREFEDAKSETEKLLVKECGELLGIDNISINDNFFEIGGNSLNAMILSTRLLNELNIKIPLSSIFEKPVIKELAKVIDNSKKVFDTSIKRVENKEFYPLSPAQKRMYFLSELSKENTAYNMPILLELSGNIKEEKIKNTLTSLIERHEILRTSFIKVGEEIKQKINKEVKLDFEVIKVSSKNINLNNYIKAFDLSKAPLMRVKLFKVNETESLLFIDMHHIISDGISMNIIMSEFSKIYKGEVLEKLKIRYVDYCEYINNLDLQKEKEYWLKEFSEDIPVLELPLDFNRPQLQESEGNLLDFIIDKEVKDEVKSLAIESETSEFMVLISVFSLLLRRYSRQDNIVIGTPIAGRPNKDVENVMGLFVNTLPLRFSIDLNSSYLDYLKSVKDKCLKAYENMLYPFDELVDELNIPRNLSRNPLFDVMFVMQNMKKEKIDLQDFSMNEVENKKAVSKFDLTFIVEEREDYYVLSVEYAKSLFKDESIEYLIKHYVNLLKQVVKNKNLKLKDFSMLDKAERKLLEDFNESKASYDLNTNIIKIFEKQAAKTPLNIALQSSDGEVTYKELNNRVNILGKKLRKEGVKKGTSVAVIADRSIEMITAIYAILKLGAVYVPIDKKYPKNRVEYLIKESESKVILTDALDNFNYEIEEKIKVLSIDLELNIKETEEIVENIQCNIKGEDTAYIIFTSGTTGNPKGVEMLHSNLLNLVSHMQSKYPLEDKDAFLFKSAFTFDASISEIFGWFLKGGRLVILERDGEKDPEIIVKTIEKYKVSHINFVPSMLRVFFNTIKNNKHINLKSLKYIFAGGEVFSKDFYIMGKELCPNVKIGNFYGPTETCVYACGFMKDKDENFQRVPIGKPLENVKIYILDENMNLCSINEPGELCIAGAGVGKGYKNREELTKEKFIENPFNKNESMYRSGDLGRFLPDGNIEYLGRIDSQVKLRGFRIEMGEIENSLRNFQDIEDAVVIVKTVNNEDKILCAYIISSKEISLKDVRNNLKKELPEFMIPSHFMRIEKKPLTVNGKVDIKALPEIDLSLKSTEFIEARTKTEALTANLFKEVLKVSKVSVIDNFFDLGGHSLNLIELVNKINNEFNIKVSLKEVFMAQTVENIAALIESKEKVSLIPLERAEKREYYPVTDEQLNMYSAYEMNKDSIGFNVPCAFNIKGKIDKDRFEEGFKACINKHEILRTSFVKVDGMIMQKVREKVDFKIEYLENSEVSIEDIKSFVKPFNLEKDLLIRVSIIKKNEEEYILFMDMHHIIVDGASVGILTKELLTSYKGYNLQPLDYQFKDYSLWREKKKLLSKEKEENYWLSKIDDTIEPLNLETTYERKNIISEKGDTIITFLGEEEKRLIKKRMSKWNCTLFQFMMLLYYVTLSQYSNQRDIVIGAVTYGRENAEIEELIGLFIKTLPVRISLGQEEKVKDFINVIKNNVMEAIDNSSCSMEEILRKSSYKPVKGRRPLFDVAMVVQNEDLGSINEEGITLESIDLEVKVSKYDIFFEVMEDENNIRLKFEYCTDLFSKKYIEKFRDKLIDNMNLILSNEELSIDILLKDVLDNCYMDNFEVSENTEIEFNF